MRTLTLTLKLTLALPLLALLFPALAFAGSQTYTTPGTYTFTVPQYTGSLTVTLLGGGGGGGGGQGGGEPENGGPGIGSSGEDGGNGGDVSFGSVVANGGRGGCGGGSLSLSCSGGNNAVGGGAFDSGRNTNVTAGGAAGGAGGTGGYICQHCLTAGWNAAGGSYGEDGKKTVKTYSAGELTPGSTVTVFIEKGSEKTFGASRNGTSENGGQGGAGGAGELYSADSATGAASGTDGSPGQNGGVTITWNGASPPPSSCSVVQSYTAPGTYTSPVSGAYTIQVIGGGGGAGGSALNLRGGKGGSGAASSIVGSFGTFTAHGGKGGTGASSYTTNAEAGSDGDTESKSVVLTAGENFTVAIGGGGGGGGTGGLDRTGPSGGDGTAGSTSIGGVGGIGGKPENCAWSGNAHSAAATSGGGGGTSSGGGGGGGAALDNGSYGCTNGYDGGAGTLASGGTGGGPNGYTSSGNVTSPGGVAPGHGGGVRNGSGGGGGGSGAVNICGAPVSCSVTFDQNPLTGAATTMRWTSNGADLFYIQNVGWVGASGSAQVFSPGDYSGTVSGPDGIGSCSATLVGDNKKTCASTSLTCKANGNLVDACGTVTTCQYGCSATTNQCKAKNQCVAFNTCNTSGTKVVNACNGSTIDDCSARGAGWVCIAGACKISSIGFEAFDAHRGAISFRATGHLQASPFLVREGDTTNLYWNVTNASACTVSGNNGDGGPDVWDALFSGEYGKVSGPIESKTIYTLRCTSLSGVVPPFIEETATVNVLPSFQEM